MASDLAAIRKQGLIVKAAREIALAAIEFCPTCLLNISATSLDGSAPDDVDLLIDIFNVPVGDSERLQEILREVYSPYLFQDNLVVAVILHDEKETEMFYMAEVKRIKAAPDVLKWISERYDDLLKKAG